MLRDVEVDRLYSQRKKSKITKPSICLKKNGIVTYAIQDVIIHLQVNGVT